VLVAGQADVAYGIATSACRFILYNISCLALFPIISTNATIIIIMYLGAHQHDIHSVALMIIYSVRE